MTDIPVWMENSQEWQSILREDKHKNFYAENGQTILQLETEAYSLVNQLLDDYNLTDKSYKDICDLIGKTLIASDMQKIVKSLQNELLVQMKTRVIPYDGLFRGLK